MLRRGFRVLMLGVCGAVTTVGVAWTCALRVQLQGTPKGDHSRSCIWRPPGSPIEGRLFTDRWEAFGSVRYASMIKPPDEYWPEKQPLSTLDQVRAVVPRWSRHNLLDWIDRQQDWPPGPFTIQGVDARGWPFHALWCAYAWSSETEPDLWYWLPDGGGIQLGDGLMPTEPADWWPRAALPCLPIWSGFAGDTVLYAGAWWFLLTAPGRVRGRWRRGRGVCVRCAYDLRGLAAGAACPECGARVRK